MAGMKVLPQRSTQVVILGYHSFPAVIQLWKDRQSIPQAMGSQNGDKGEWMAWSR